MNNNFEGEKQEVNNIASHAEPIPRRNRKSQKKNPKSNQANADPWEDGLNYGIDSLNLAEPSNYSVNDYKWLLAQLREGHMADKEYRNNITER